MAVRIGPNTFSGWAFCMAAKLGFSAFVLSF